MQCPAKQHHAVKNYLKMQVLPNKLFPKLLTAYAHILQSLVSNVQTAQSL